ncbi:MAG: putative lipid-binding transport protein (Tim44 family) [Alphaproteobacteria bacterium]|jgi:predicted lipid-binding transport protein (Tim44 family)
MEFISLLILAAIAGFLFYQLRSVLGQTPPDHAKKTPASKKQSNTLYDHFLKKDQKKDQKTEKAADVIAMPHNSEHRFIKANADINRDDIIKTFNNIKMRYPDFDLNRFVDGAKGAYDMILDSFNRGLPEDIKDYMSDDIYQGYRKLLDDYTDKNYTYQTIVTRIEQAMVVSANTDEVSAKITVEFQAHNISSLKDEDGAIIQGDPDAVVAVTDIWVFERQYSTNNPSWLVTAIS